MKEEWKMKHFLVELLPAAALSFDLDKAFLVLKK